MNRFEKLKAVGDYAGKSYWAERIYTELCALNAVSNKRDAIWADRIEQACDLLLSFAEKNGVLTNEICQNAENSLADLSPEMKQFKGICVGHAHIDMNWMWGYQETTSITVDTFRTMLNLMNEYPDFTFAQSQASTYEMIERHAPEMLPEIKQRIKEGRWEVTASSWVEADKNMPDGESLSRHILTTKRYLSKLLDIDPKSLRLDFEPDTFGHNAMVPEILARGGVEYYYHCRGRDGGDIIYNWEAPSGSRVLAYCEPQWYNATITPDLFVDYPLVCMKYGVKTFLKVYGVGDHGGGPTRRDVERIIDIGTWPLMPSLKFGTFHEFFDAIAPYRDSFPTYRGEMNFVFTGCYTSQARIKMANRVAEARMNDSEALSASATALSGAPSKSALYDKAWRMLLFNQFHDILPGSGKVETREYALGKFQETLATVNTNANLAMRSLSDSIDTTSIPFVCDKQTTSEGSGVGYGQEPNRQFLLPATDRGYGPVRAFQVFNTLGFDRSEIATLTVWDWTDPYEQIEITDEDGNILTHAVLGRWQGYWGHSYLTILVQIAIPAFGYRTLILRKKELTGFGAVGPVPNGRTDNDIDESEKTLENEHILAVFDPLTMELVSLTDKTTGKKLIDKPSCLFRLIMENPRYGMTSWRVGPALSVLNLNETDKVRFIGSSHSQNGLEKTISYKIAFGNSNLDVTVSLRKGEKMLRFTAVVDWHELPKNGQSIPQLNFFVPVSYEAKDYRYDIPYGSVVRPPLSHDVPANSYMEIGTENENHIFLTSAEKYGFRGWENAGALTLLRSSYDPDPYPENGIYDLHFAVGFGETAGEIRDIAASYNHPLPFCSATAHTGSLPLRGQLVDVKGTARVFAVKNPEEGEGLILRAASIEDKDAPLTLTFPRQIRAAFFTDLNENSISDCPFTGNTVSLTLSAHQLTTLRILF